MLQDNQTIRYYQKLTDAMVDMWNRGYRFEEIKLFTDGYIACLLHSQAIEGYLTHRLETEAHRFLRDPYNFESAMPQPETDRY